MENLRIFKFGGAALSHLSAFDNMLNTLKAKQEESKILLVVSAFSKTTKKLRLSAEVAETGNQSKAEDIIDEIAGEYKSYAEKLISEKALQNTIIQQIEEAKSELFSLIRGVSIVKELTARTLDLIMSYGEKLSLLIAFHFIKINSINSAFIDSSNIIITNSNFGQAYPLLSETEKNINEKVIPLFDKHEVVITQGFVAANAEGVITTMGIESSNLTAALYAKYLKCREIIIFTDVNGIRTADPKANPNTQLINRLSYKQAYLLGKCGLKLIFSKMIRLAAAEDMKVIIKSGIESSAEETVISSEANDLPICVTINNGETNLIKVPFSAKDVFFTIRNGKMATSSQYSKAVKRAISKAQIGKIDKAKFRVIALEDAFMMIELAGNANIEASKCTKCEKNTKVYFNIIKQTSGETGTAFYRTATKSVETLFHKL